MEKKQSIVTVENLWFSFNGRPVLRDVSFEVERGEFLALIGPNGGGKTTLLKLMLGLLEPDRGRVRVFGKSPRHSAHSIGYVPQEAAASRSFPLSALEAVLMGRLQPGRLRSRYGRQDRAAGRGPDRPTGRPLPTHSPEIYRATMEITPVSSG